MIHETGIKLDENSDDHLGVGVLKTKNQFSIPCNLIVEVDVGSPLNGEYGPMGPDIALLVLPSSGHWVNSLEMGKSFYNLQGHRTRDLSEDACRNFSMSGFPADALKSMIEEANSNTVIARHIVFSGDVNNDNYFEENIFDYVEIQQFPASRNVIEYQRVTEF